MSNSKVLGTVQLSEGPLQGEFTVRESAYLMDPEVSMIFLDAEDGETYPVSITLADQLMTPGEGRTFVNTTGAYRSVYEALRSAGIVSDVKPIRYGRSTAALCKITR